MSLYLDASAIVPLFVAENASEAVQGLLNDVQEDLVVSTFATAEAVSAISRRVRRGEVDPEEADSWLGLLDDWVASDAVQLAVNDQDIRRAGNLVRKFETRLLTPDAIHVALCQRHGLPMLTLDERLADAAGMLGVEAVIPV